MIKTIIKKIVMLSLIASIAAPISAMDSSDNSSWFSWSNAAVLFAGMGLGYWAYSSWITKPVSRTLSSNFKGQKVQTTAMYQPESEKHISLSDEEVHPLFLSKSLSLNW